MTFGEIKDKISSNLDDAGITFYSAEDIADSLQDAYDDIVFQSKCIVKKTQIDFRVSAYYDFSASISDFMQVTAIFNNNVNRWLKDNLSMRDFDKLRNDWELWVGTPEWWCATDLRMNVLVPQYSAVPLYQMDLYYNAVAPTITSDSDTPLIATDMHDLLEWYCTGDLLEQAEEYTKATNFFTLYVPTLEEYKERVQLSARRDLLTKI